MSFISVEQFIEKLYLASRDMQANDPKCRQPKNFIFPCFCKEMRQLTEEAFLNYFNAKYGIMQTRVNLETSNDRISTFAFPEVGFTITLLDV